MRNFDLAFQRLEEAIEDKTTFVNLLAIEPFFEPLRSDAPVHEAVEKAQPRTLNSVVNSSPNSTEWSISCCAPVSSNRRNPPYVPRLRLLPSEAATEAT